MKFQVIVAPVTQVSTPLLVINLFENADEPTAATGAVDNALGAFIAGLISSKEITGKLNEVTIFHTFGKLPAERVAVVGLGKKEDFTFDRARQVAGTVARRAQQLKIERLTTIAHGGQAGLAPLEAAQAVAEGSLLATYRYLKFKTEHDEPKPALAEVTIVERDQAKVAELERGLARGQALAEAAVLARDLANGPGNLVTPTYLAEQAQAVCADNGLDCQILGPDEMRQLGMGALLGVAQGSTQAPRLIVMRYRGGGEDGKTLAFVGKGITFDSGGISLKPGDKMDEMKMDMSGAAAVIGAMQAIGHLKPRVNVLGIAPATENMPGGKAYKPGDILTAMNGKTIEVLNTDAEGRIVLADAVAYAAREGADLIVDLATLTGACVVALGYHATGAVGNNDKVVAALIEAGERTGERIWQLPAWDDYREQIKSDIADVKNTGGRAGGTITGALFIERFVDNRPWVHLDIAGTAWVERDKPYVPKGASGWGVRLLAEFAEKWAKQPLL